MCEICVITIPWAHRKAVLSFKRLDIKIFLLHETTAKTFNTNELRTT